MITSFERRTFALPAEMIATIKQAVKDGEYASTSEAVQEALRNWEARRQVMRIALSELKADIDQGLADAAEGRIKTFDTAGIIKRGKQLNTSS